MSNEQIIERWKERATDPEIAAQLADLLASGDADAIEDAFYRSLEFGTAGLRGVLGAGTNRMNIYTVGQATQGLCDYLNAHKAEGATPSIAVCYDSRINADLFARETAAIAAGNGIVAHIYPRLEPTPALSFAVRYLKCDAGVALEWADLSLLPRSGEYVIACATEGIEGLPTWAPANPNYARWHLAKAKDADGNDILTFTWSAGTTVIMR